MCYGNERKGKTNSGLSGKLQSNGCSCDDGSSGRHRIFENYSGEEKTHQISGKPAFESQAKTALSYFSERKQIPLSYEHRKNETEVKIDYWAILAVDFPNGMKKGQEFRLEGKSIFHFGSEKIKGIQDFS